MKKTSWILLVLLVIVAVAYFVIDYRKDHLPAATTTEEPVIVAYLPLEPEAILISIRIYDQDYHVVEMDRTPETGLWEVSLPTAGPADQSMAGSLETQLGSLRITTELGVVPGLEEFGLTFPSYTLKLVYTNDAQHKIEIGDSSPTGSGYYVQLDDGALYVISKYSLDSILAIVENPPYTSTPTPSP